MEHMGLEIICKSMFLQIQLEEAALECSLQSLQFFVTAWQKKSRPKNCLIKPPPVIQGSLNGTHLGGIKLDANVAIGHFGRFPLVLLVWVGVI